MCLFRRVRVVRSTLALKKLRLLQVVQMRAAFPPLPAGGALPLSSSMCFHLSSSLIAVTTSIAKLLPIGCVCLLVVRTLSFFDASSSQLPRCERAGVGCGVRERRRRAAARAPRRRHASVAPARLAAAQQCRQGLSRLERFLPTHRSAHSRRKVDVNDAPVASSPPPTVLPHRPACSDGRRRATGVGVGGAAGVAARPPLLCHAPRDAATTRAYLVAARLVALRSRRSGASRATRPPLCAH